MGINKLMIIFSLLGQLAYAQQPQLDKSPQYLKETLTQLARQLENALSSHQQLVKQQFEQLNQEVQDLREEVEKSHQQLSQIDYELRETNRHLEGTNAILEKISQQMSRCGEK